MCGMILIFAASMSLVISKAEEIISTFNEDLPDADKEAAETFTSRLGE